MKAAEDTAGVDSQFVFGKESCPTAASDTQEPFAFLSEHIPGWFQSLQAVSAGTEGRRVESVAKSTPVASPSAIPIVHGMGTGLSSPYRHQPMNMKRKRPWSLADSHHSSNHNSYRARNHVSVVYDADAQKCLENIVNDIAQAKTLIRKARPNTQAASEVKAPVLPQVEDSDDELDDNAVIAQIRLKRSSLNSSTKSNRSIIDIPDANGLLEQAEQDLDHVQDLCLTAAFQLLRDGDCRLETQSAVARLDGLLEVSRKEVERLEKELKQKEVDLTKDLAGSKKDVKVVQEATMSPIFCGDFIYAPGMRVGGKDRGRTLAPIHLSP